MKKFVFLAVLALGLCASPALALTIDFTKDIQFPDNATSWELTYPGSTATMSILMQGSGLDSNAWYKSANGMSIELGPFISFGLYFGLNGQKPLPEDLAITLSAQDIYMVPVLKIGDADYKNMEAIYISEPGLFVFNWPQVTSPDATAYALVLYNFSDSPKTITLSSIEYTPSAIPVPAAVWLLGTGVAGVAALRRKFK